MTDKPAEPGRAFKDEHPVTGTGVKRPLVLVVLSLLLGLVAAAWGLKITRIWLVAGLAGLLAVLFLVYFLGYYRGSQDQRGKDNEGPTKLG